jgi:hypothetical protein
MSFCNYFPEFPTDDNLHKVKVTVNIIKQPHVINFSHVLQFIWRKTSNEKLFCFQSICDLCRHAQAYFLAILPQICLR